MQICGLSILELSDISHHLDIVFKQMLDEILFRNKLVSRNIQEILLGIRRHFFLISLGILVLDQLNAIWV